MATEVERLFPICIPLTCLKRLEFTCIVSEVRLNLKRAVKSSLVTGVSRVPPLCASKNCVTNLTIERAPGNISSSSGIDPYRLTMSREANSLLLESSTLALD